MAFTITESMSSSHKELSALLEKLVDGVNLKPDQVMEMFDDFRARLFEHFNIEEQVIFGYDNITDEKSKEIIRELLHEHGVMRSMTGDIEAQLKANLHIDLVPFLDLMNKHQSTESQVLYPKLDYDLTDEEKEKMEDKISKILKK